MENSCLVAASPASKPFLFLVLLAFCEKNDAFCSVALNNLIFGVRLFYVTFYYYFQQVKFTASL